MFVVNVICVGLLSNYFQLVMPATLFFEDDFSLNSQQLKMSTTKHKALVTFEKNEHALACRRKFHR